MSNQASADLRTFGPLLEIEIAQRPTFRDKFKHAQRRPYRGYALIDTGSSQTCVDGSVILEYFQLNASDAIPVETASGTEWLPTAHVDLSIPNLLPSPKDGREVLIIQLTAPSVDSKPVIALLGRDILSELSLVYDGRKGVFEIV